jgi:hypothetical protein
MWWWVGLKIYDDTAWLPYMLTKGKSVSKTNTSCNENELFRLLWITSAL